MLRSPSQSSNEFEGFLNADYLNENSESVDYIMLHNVMAEVSELVCKSKDDYQFVRKLIPPKTSSKTRWSILKTF